MKQIVERKRGNELALIPPATQKNLTPNMPDTAVFIKETETTVIKKERVYMIPCPVCNHCGAVKEHVVGAWFECINQSCPTHDPDTGSAIPLPGEGETVIDVEPIKEAA